MFNQETKVTIPKFTNVSEIPAGAILAYKPSPRLLAFLGIEIGEELAGLNPKYVHISVWDGTKEVAALGNGVVVCSNAPVDCDVLVAVGMPDDHDGFAKAFTWLQSKIGKTPYAWWDLAWVWFLRRFNLHHIKDWPDSTLICSALGCKFLRTAGINVFPGLFSCEVLPSDYDYLTNTEFVCVGSFD